jgi:hypothetical protein
MVPPPDETAQSLGDGVTGSDVEPPGPQEYVRTISFCFYQPEKYHHLFQDSKYPNHIGR